MHLILFSDSNFAINSEIFDDVQNNQKPSREKLNMWQSSAINDIINKIFDEFIVCNQQSQEEGENLLFFHF